MLLENGIRKYVSARERAAFLTVADRYTLMKRLFLRVLAETGCRISEGLALTGQNIDLNEGLIYIETLKQRRKGIYRAVPISPDLGRLFLTAREAGYYSENARPLWQLSRMTGWRHVHAAMTEAGIAGVQASPKGLRHGFAMAALTAGVPINLVQRWLGHARIETTSIYANAVGPEERAMAARMWGKTVLLDPVKNSGEPQDGRYGSPLPCASGNSGMSDTSLSDKQKEEGADRRGTAPLSEFSLPLSQDGYLQSSRLVAAEVRIVTDDISAREGSVDGKDCNLQALLLHFRINGRPDDGKIKDFRGYDVMIYTNGSPVSDQPNHSGAG